MKHLISFLFAFVLLLSLTACSSEHLSSTSNDTAQAQGSSSLFTDDSMVSSSIQENLQQSSSSVVETTESTSSKESSSAKSTAPVHHQDTASRPQPPESSQGRNPPAEQSEESVSAPVDPQPEKNPGSSVPPAEISPAPSDFAEQVIILVNEERSRAGLAPLIADTQLSADALVRAKETAEVFDHIRPDGSNFDTAVSIEWQTVGENIAWGQASPETVMKTWMDSPGHRQNILSSSYSKIGVGVVEDTGRLYWVQLFVG